MDPADQPRPSDLLIREQSDLHILEAAGSDGPFNPDGTVNMVLIRPCNGRGVYNNIYEADVLKRDAGKFKGWPMFDNHESPIARRARLPFPRPVTELAGVIRESWWDPTLTTGDDAKYGYEPGAVIGKCALTDVMEALVRKIPEAIRGSLNAQATNKRMGERAGKKGWIVEGFVDDPENSSYDLVTKAGAGGRVASVLEGLYDGSNATDGLSAVLESVTDDQLVAFLREHRPDVLGGDPSMNLQEALQSDEVKGFIGQMIAEGVQAGIAEALPAAIQEERQNIQEAVREEIGGAHRLRTLAGEARGVIESTKGIPPSAKTQLLAAYGITVDANDTVTAGPSLAVIEAELDGSGNVTKSAKDVLLERINEDVEGYRTVIREAAPTVPQSRTGGTRAPAASAAGSGFGGDGSAWADRVKRRGLDPSIFGAPKPEPAGKSE